MYEVFTDIKRGKRLTASARERGQYPFITAGKFSNGISAFIKNDEHEMYHNAITIDMFGKAFYQGFSFKCDDNITILKNKTFSKDVYLFLVECLNVLNKKYSYGYQLRPNRLKNDIIRLPVDSSGKPNWQFMEEYVKKEEERQRQLVLNYCKEQLSR